MIAYANLPQSGTAPQRHRVAKFLAYESSTRPDKSLIVEILAKSTFNIGEGELFRDGYESRFSRSVTHLIKDYGFVAIKVLSIEIKSHSHSDDVSYEALKWIGRSRHRATHGARFNLLTECLTDTSSVIREGAAVGLALLGDPSAVTELEQAILLEPNRQVREDMRQVVEDFRADA